MKTKLKSILKKNKLILNTVLFMKKYLADISLYFSTNKALNFKRNGENVIFYLGIPAHANLGDLAQGVCIRKWLQRYYPEIQVIEIETNALVNTRFTLLKKLQEKYMEGDIILFQSGYTTTDLGGFADEMHRAVIQALPEAKMLMLPQTIYFKNRENEERTSKIYNSAINMLFLARDKVSFDKALEMFPDINVKLFPDIVTTLIGQEHFSNKREGILFCCRDDGEKFYSDTEIDELIAKCKKLCLVKRTDTTKRERVSDIVRNAEKYILNEIDEYSRYELIITDRYHGTILSLVAETPVIIIKTNDHKVTTGAVWFDGIYDEYVHLADSLEDAYDIAVKVLKEKKRTPLRPYFEAEYYSKLRSIFEDINNDNL